MRVAESAHRKLAVETVADIVRAKGSADPSALLEAVEQANERIRGSPPIPNWTEWERHSSPRSIWAEASPSPVSATAALTSQTEMGCERSQKTRVGCMKLVVRWAWTKRLCGAPDAARAHDGARG